MHLHIRTSSLDKLSAYSAAAMARTAAKKVPTGAMEPAAAWLMVELGAAAAPLPAGAVGGTALE